MMGDQVEPESLRDIIHHLAVPALAGVYLSLADLERIGRATGVHVAAHSRRRAIEQLFRGAGLDDQLSLLLDGLISEIEAQREAYRRTAPALLSGWDSRAGETVELLQRMSSQVAGAGPYR